MPSNTYADHTPERQQAPGRRHRGLRLTSAKETPSEKLQAVLDKAGLSEVKVTDVIDDTVKVWAPDYAGWLLAKIELRAVWPKVERI